MDSTKNERATKKQKELLSFIDGFIKGNGYGPSYREVMRALEYKSVSTVAAHVNGLIAKGYLAKTGTSARSLVVVQSARPGSSQQEWLARELATRRTACLDSDTSESQETAAAIDRVAKLFNISL